MNYEILKGYKTFVVGALMIALGILQSDNTMIMEGIGFITLRLAIRSGK